MSVRKPVVPFEGLRPAARTSWSREVLAGLALAALAIPEVLGYARIAGMPVITGLYTMLAPMVVFAVLGSSRHLVVGADSATAAILASGIGALAVTGGPRYISLATTAAAVTAALLLLARAVRLGLLADFLSRTVLVGFLTGVGIQVAVGQLPGLLGLSDVHGAAPVVIERTLTELSRAHPPTAVLSGCVLVLVLGGRRAAPKLPWGLVAVIGAVLAAQWVDLAGRGVAVLGPVAAGLPSPRLPWPALADVRAVLPVAASMVVVILAQSAATARAYATRFGEHVDTDADLVALGGANLAAAATGTFVVNGSPTKTQMVVDGGGRSQRAQLAAAAAALLTCLLLTAPLARLPLAALAGVVFVIGVELVDVAGLRRILAVRREEFVVALLTTASVVVLGVELGIAVAVVISMVDHLRHSYTPPSGVLVKSADGHWRSVPVTTGARTEGGLLIYRFASGLYFANAARLAEDVDRLVGGGPPLRWFCLDAAAVGDIDYSASEVLHTVAERLRGQGVRLVLSNVLDDVHRQLERYGLVELIGPEAFYETSGAVLDDFRRPRGPDQG